MFDVCPLAVWATQDTMTLRPAAESLPRCFANGVRCRVGLIER